MLIGQKLKNARIEQGLSQEDLADKLHVSRQTISNWENGKTYPDIMSIIHLSDLYSLSLDVLLKGDDVMLHHLEESTDTVKSNKKLTAAILLNIVMLIAFMLLNQFITKNHMFLVIAFSLSVMTTAFLYYEIIKRF